MKDGNKKKSGLRGEWKQSQFYLIIYFYNFFFRRLQKQLDNIKIQTDPHAEIIVERISLSENEKEAYSGSKLPKLNAPSNNKVYRYFSQSAKVDSDLFNYQRYFSDLTLDHIRRERTDLDFSALIKKPAQVNSVAIKKKVEEKRQLKGAKIDCPSCTSHTECSRCHKKLEMFCKECNDDVAYVSPEATTQLEIGYNEPELPFSIDQQVVVYRASDQNAPYSFNIERDSMFYKDTMEDLRSFSEMKLVNYIKLYGDLRRNKIADDLKLKKIPEKIEERKKETGTLPKVKQIDKVSF